MCSAILNWRLAVMETKKINFLMYSTLRTGGTRTILQYANEFQRLGHEVSLTTLFYDDWFPLNKDIKVISKISRLELYYFFKKSEIKNRLNFTNLNSTISFLKKLYYLSPKSDLNIATFFPTAYVASWKKNEAIPFYILMHMPGLFIEDPIERVFYEDTLFLPVNKIVNSTWLQKQVKDKSGIEYPLVNTGAVDNRIFTNRHNYRDQNNDKYIDIIALGKGGFKKATSIFEAVSTVRSINRDKIIRLHFFGRFVPKGVSIDNKLTFFHKNLSDEDLAKLYSSSDIQITFSEAESFPLPPLEAMASGCAVITTPYGTEDYAFDGKNALIVEPNNTEMLVNRINTLVQDNDLRNKLIGEGLLTARKFRFEDQARQIEKIFESTINE